MKAKLSVILLLLLLTGISWGMILPKPAQAEPFLGEIRILSCNFAPKGWAQCNGQLLPINQNQALFSLLGTTYGGDGRANFALPDLRGRVAMHNGYGYDLGQRGGSESHTLSWAEMPQHGHGFATSQPGTLNAPAAGAILAGAQTLDRRDVKMYGPGSGTNIFSSTGGGQAHLNMQPYLALNYCIAVQGIFPSYN
ncbi:MAG: tail fiber protein [Desulfotomaculaceae bacterium]|nr:tail fiber protein [Desulfotomaculaceae bacterium]